MYKNCVFIIESPNKIAKIKELTGSSFVFATGGHFVELVNIEVNKEFNPIFEIKKSTDKKKDKSTHINHMINQCKDKVVYIATDLDREGYGIGYKFYEKIKNLAKTIYRTEFHEITKSGVEKGLNNAVLFSQSNLNLYYSWLGRIVSDQFIGFTLTPYLRKNIKNFEVSAGRVQTPALSILVELDKKIQAFEQKNNDEKLSYSIEAIIDALGSQISIALVEENKMKVFETKELAQNFLNDLKNNLNPLAFLDAIEQKDKEKAPPKPFTTSNLLKDGVRILEMGVKQIQEHAQKLFEAGLITYIRTDSEALSKEYLQEHKAFFEGIYPSVYEYREYKAGKNSQAEAHEAIRITHPHCYEDLKKVCEEHNITDIDDLKVYTLIFFNTICSQSKNAIYENTTLNFKVKTRSFKCSFSQLKSKGFKAIKDLEEEKKLVASYVNNRENISSIKEQNEIAHETIRLQSAFEVWDFFEKLVSYEHSIYTNINLTRKISIINIALISKTQANIEISAQLFNKEKLESKKRYRIIMTFEFEPIEIDTKSVPLNPTGFIVTGYDVTEIAILKDLDEKNKVKDDGVKSRIIHTEKKDPHMSQYKDVKEQ
ncbi:type IA DNA topoisomerase [Helicobacter pylori]|uniref:DNA topoisomerase n=3 Tax=Helicobacter pylori TaxID=210 RepID=A0A3N5CZS4_HELPX|nr:VirB8/TrbF family protein [Helicobacter pylori]EJB31513.1 DNA topoisomerase I [Helicobacter pylori NQ4228]MBM0611940.1 type IA DNA topoisomerase [Helicobacter pylori]MBM0627986.1 type IA DNA topoisomerase [Helicobacter pylori]OOQ11468.1 DNA topoisomerase I [Helicobacter pylori]PDX09514.1 DNA topoisomerase I [Helicobacter pylori]